MKLLHSNIIGDSGPDLVILHGFLGMGDNWKTLGNRFAKDGFRVHLVDQRNHGRSFHHNDFSYEHMAKDLQTYLDYHNLKDIFLLGHSMGGKTAMEFATSNQGLVSKLVVADIAPKAYPQHHQDILTGLSKLNFSEITSRSQADNLLSQYVKEAGVRQFLLKNVYWVEKGQLGLRINLPVLTEQVEEVGKSLAKDAIYQGPTLFLRGSGSGYIEDMDQILIKNHFKSAQLLTISNAGHWLHAENPSEFYQNVIDFL